MVRATVLAKIAEITAKFPELTRHRISATLSMQNSTTRSASDKFSLKFIVNGKLFKNIVLEKCAESIYEAISNATEVLVEQLVHVADKRRSLKLATARRYQYSDAWENYFESAR